jgi:hypothetical protein
MFRTLIVSRLMLGPLAAVLLALVTVGASSAGAQEGLPDVDIAAVLEIHDTTSWLPFYTEFLGASKQAPKSLTITVPAGTGGRRSLVLNDPKLEVSLVKGTTFVKVVARGKVSGAEALATLPPFELAVADIQASGADGQTIVGFGLASVTANLNEFYAVR